jgi:hypothetical protein
LVAVADRTFGHVDKRGDADAATDEEQVSGVGWETETFT